VLDLTRVCHTVLYCTVLYPQGASKNLNLMEWDKLWTINKRIVDPVCPRHTAVLAGRVPLLLSNGPEAPFTRIIPKHKKHPRGQQGNAVLTPGVAGCGGRRGHRRGRR